MIYKNTTRSVLAALVLLAGASFAAAETGMVELLNLTGGRQTAMGETASLFDPDPFNLEFNPSLMVGLKNGRVGFSHNEFIQDRSTNTLAAIFPAAGVDFGIHVRLSSLGDIEVRQAPTTDPDYIAEARNFAVKAFSAIPVTPRLFAGISAGWLMEKIDIHRASTLVFGAGAAYYTDFNLAAHASVANIGGKVKFIEQEDDPPTIIRAGLGYRWLDLTVNADYVNVKSGDSHLHFGGEYLLEKMLFLRAGFQTGYDSRGFSAGAGFLYEGVRVDYAFVPYDSDLGNSHRFTLTYSFD